MINGNSCSLTSARVAAPLYSTFGGVLNAAMVAMSPATIAAGGSASFALRFADRLDTNRVVFKRQARG